MRLSHFALGVLACGLLTSPWGARRADAQAEITAVVKQVAHKSAAGDWRNSTVGVRLGGNSSVRTGRRARCEVQLGQNLIKLSERSAITLTGNQVALDAGKLYGDFKTDTVIKSRKTLATIKGTGALCSYEWFRGYLMFVVDCLSGGPVTLDVPGWDQQLVVNSGERGRAPADGMVAGAPNPTVGPSPNTQSFISAEDGRATSFVDEIIRGASSVVGVGGVGDAGVDQGRLDQRDSALDGGESCQRPGSIAEPVDNHVHLAGADNSAYDGMLVSGARSGLTRALLAPRLQGDTFLYKRDGNRALGGVRLAGTAVCGGSFWEVAARPQTLFDGDETVDLTDAYGVFRNDRYGEIVVGRQRFLKGPVDLVTTGTLVSQEIMDAVTWRAPVDRYNPRTELDLSLLHDAFPLNVPGNQGGWHVRGAYHADFGSFGANAMQVNGLPLDETGVTVDAAVPVLPGKLDLYGEFGSSVFGQNIRTFGAYLPGLYEKTGFDVYVETTKGVGGAPGISVLRAYYEVTPRVTALLTADKVYSRSGVNLGVGLVADLLH